MNKSSLNLEAKMIVKKYASVSENENNIMRLIADIVLLAIRMFKIFMEILNIDDIIDDEEDFKILQSNQMRTVTATTKSSMMKEEFADKSCEVIKKKVHFQFPLKDSSVKIMKQHICTTTKLVPSIRIIEKKDKSTQTTEMPHGLIQSISTPPRTFLTTETAQKSSHSKETPQRSSHATEKVQKSNQAIEMPQRPTQASEMPKRSIQTIETPQRSIQTTKTPQRTTQPAETPQRLTHFAATPPRLIHSAVKPPRSIYSAVTPQRSTQITEKPQRSENNVLACSNTKYSCRKSEGTKPKVNYPEPTKKVELYRVELLHHLLTMQHLKQKHKPEQRFGSTRRRLEF